MKLAENLKTGGNILRFLLIIVLLGLLIPRLFTACYDLYKFILSGQDKVPSGNPMKVENPYSGEQYKPVIKVNQ